MSNMSCEKGPLLRSGGPESQDNNSHTQDSPSSGLYERSQTRWPRSRFTTVALIFFLAKIALTVAAISIYMLSSASKDKNYHHAALKVLKENPLIGKSTAIIRQNTRDLMRLQMVTTTC
jgi:hypothetical protein